MTSAQTMQATVSPFRGWVCRLGSGALLALSLGGAGCNPLERGKPELTPPVRVVAPYEVSRGDVLWAIVPLLNESGTSLFDPLAISDKLVAAAEEIEGVRTVPLNRTLQAMRALEISHVSDPGDVRRLAAAMGVDGVLVGTITAYDPYSPPTIGMSLALFARNDSMRAGDPDPIDPRTLSAAVNDGTAGPRSGFDSRPASVVSANLDANDHGVLESLRQFAHGRHDPVSAMGWRRYTASMDLYTQFATQHLVSELIAQERVRLEGLRVSEVPASE